MFEEICVSKSLRERDKNSRFSVERDSKLQSYVRSYFKECFEAS